MNSDFVDKTDLGFGLQLKNFSVKIPAHQVNLGLTPGDVSDAGAASDYFKFVVDMQAAHIERARNWTTYKDLLRNPGKGVPAVSNAPLTLTVPVAPTNAPMGIEIWFRQIAKRIKGSKNYTEGIGKDLGIISVNSAVDTESVKPVLQVQLVAGQPLIHWKKNQMDGIEIYKDNGDGTWHLLVYDMKPNHLDTSALPASGTSVNWKYKAIYRYQDNRVGSWSDEVSVVVSGEI